MRRESFSLNPYEVLGVSPNASSKEIQAAYRQHALRWHPDRNPNDEYAMRMMQRVNAAWAILKDEYSRSAYDRYQRGGANTAGGPEAWVRPPPGPPPGREWYNPPPPPPSSTACPRCQSVNEQGFVSCYSCGFPLDETQPEQGSSAWNYAPQHDANTNSRAGLPADFFQRLFAYLIDSIIVFALAMVLTIALLNWFEKSDEPVIAGTFGWIFLAMPVLYFTVLVAAWSTTLGKIIFGLRVVRNDGSKIGIGRAFARCLLYTVSFLILGIGFLMIAFRQDKRGLHDLICDTKVVHR